MSILFFGFIFGHVAIGAITGFCMALYLFRPSLLPDVAKLIGLDEDENPGLKIGLGMAIAMPIVAGTSYALSETEWMKEFFGRPGELFWLWVLAAFALGFLLGSVIRVDTVK